MQEQEFLNGHIERFIASKDAKLEAYEPCDIELIGKYRSSNEIFTQELNENFAELIWELSQAFGCNQETVLIPSLGNGIMAKGASDKSLVSAFEADPVSARIAEITCPGITVYRKLFDNALLESIAGGIEKESWFRPYGLVIGKPPFGILENKYCDKFPLPWIKKIEIFFIHLSAILLKQNGHLIYFTGRSFLKSSNGFKKEKQELKGMELVYAQRHYTECDLWMNPYDVIVLKKK